ncbi:putative Flagellar biosynthesis protein FliH with response regulator receiver domain (Modular protein) [Candidatus Nitrospira nitrificans]|uniref:Putative Flagellar biosynthesis protein FliH with response regulator receiver domain (Modular protein) n=2 Tax=Candidatus Nitrospira nitrificans TaxID=1742973 RepID=A0A0S4L2A6_9BACT|nr:putative Flagellar biosynthesis protein FliH with response regulator receiver domain (Modular protein) [Candidatus Nitrospira nitrificans]
MAGGTMPAVTGSERSVSRFQGTVLIVDADEEVRHLLHELLQPERVSVRLAGSGQEALAMVKQKAPALLIVDASLPDRDGIAVLEEAQRIDSRMIGVVMTGAASVELAVRAMRAGSSDFLTKPFPPDIVLDTVRRLLELHRIRADHTVLKHAAVRSGAVRLQSMPFQTFGDDGALKGADGLTEYERGLEDGRRYADAQRQQDFSVLTEAVGKFDAARSALQQTIDDEVIALALQIVSKILHDSAESGREQIVTQVKAALGAVPEADGVVIQAHPADAAVLEAVRAELTGRRQVALKLAIEPVASLPRGSCLLHTATRLVDASLDTQLLRLGDALRNRAHHES